VSVANSRKGRRGRCHQALKGGQAEGCDGVRWTGRPSSGERGGDKGITNRARYLCTPEAR
jgi:hypothetical protein